jgi:patatin-related protein
MNHAKLAERMASSDPTKELRLALVCYGGSSLAIYMHGVTKEILRLVKASALLEAGQEAAATPAEQVYIALLKELEADRKVRTRVVVDIIAGTSAGGINGICLAKAIAHNRPVDELRELWFDHGDIKGLLHSDAPEFHLKLLSVAEQAVLHGRAPLKGDDMARWVYDAFGRMDAAGANPQSLATLLPDRSLLELFVTITDHYGYDRQVPGVDPTPVYDSRHRHVLGFRFGDGDDDFGLPGTNVALTFAARTTSSIPGVFPPVSLEGLGKSIGGEVTRLEKHFFRHYELAGVSPRDTFFVDGGVLDNKPFGHVVAAIRRRTADVEVSRRLVYIEPDPGGHKAAGRHDEPHVFQAAVGGLTGIPRAEPILDDLLEIAALNERVERIQDIVKTQWDDIADKVNGVANLDGIPQSPDDAELKTMSDALNDAARTQAGYGYATYIRLKISGVVDRYAKTACSVCDLPDDSTHALLAREVLRAWAREEKLFDRWVDPETSEPAPTARQLEFLHTFDLGYRERRLRFVIDALRGWYPSVGTTDYPTREQLDNAKSSLYEAVELLRDAMDGRGYDDALSGHFKICFAVDAMRERMQRPGFTPIDYVVEFRQQLDDLENALVEYLGRTLGDFNTKLYAKMVEVTKGWPEPRKRDLLLRYLGFPFWDVLLYSIQSLTDVGERDDVKIVRISPIDSHHVPAPPEPPKKLVGAKQGHFGAFLSNRGGREHDYLWGRVDGAERVIGMLVRRSPLPNESPAARKTREEDENAQVDQWTGHACAGILAEDGSSLKGATELVALVGNHATPLEP